MRVVVVRTHGHQYTPRGYRSKSANATFLPALRWRRHTERRAARGSEPYRGTRQVVILGAGLDSFAYHNPFADLGVRVFEVDHPATQEWKRQALAPTGMPSPTLLRGPSPTSPWTSSTTTSRRGWRPGGVDLVAPAFFLWLGVVPHLTLDAVDATLRVAAVPRAGVAFD
jgi:hypothetical protein